MKITTSLTMAVKFIFIIIFMSQIIFNFCYSESKTKDKDKDKDKDNFIYLKLSYGMNEKQVIKLMNSNRNTSYTSKTLDINGELYTKLTYPNKLDLIFDHKKKLISALLIYSSPLTLTNEIDNTGFFYQIPSSLIVEKNHFPNCKRIIDINSGLTFEISLASKRITSFAIEDPEIYKNHKEQLLLKTLDQHIDDIKNSDQVSNNLTINYYLKSAITLGSDPDLDDENIISLPLKLKQSNKKNISIIDGFEFINLH
ncbi:MAG: hypothetical protein HQK51_17995 [Oligoflexia bacterium]|nr:hypothetical protein [Oligoflexia bacterium]